MEFEFKIKSIGTFRSPYKHELEAPRQAPSETLYFPETYIELHQDSQLELGLKDLDGFERIWVIFSFHKKSQWQALVQPPRGSDGKRGVFATRSPLHPNHLGLSCLRIKRLEGRKIFVESSDLLDETPIFDIKPYIPYCDSFPQSSIGWLTGIEKDHWKIIWKTEAQKKQDWLFNHGIFLVPIVENHLGYDPTDGERKRVVLENPKQGVFSYRTWRVRFVLAENQKLEITDVFSGYSKDDLRMDEDPYGDKNLHREFESNFSYKSN